jgi:hypothetical protein
VDVSGPQRVNSEESDQMADNYMFLASSAAEATVLSRGLGESCDHQETGRSAAAIAMSVEGRQAEALPLQVCLRMTATSVHSLHY